MVTANGKEELLLVGTLMSEVVPERVEWLWPGRLPFGKIAVLDGDPGLGNVATPDPEIPADIAEVDQGVQEGQGNHIQRCLHGFPDDVGCHLCDHQHPYRFEGSDQA
jgi:hypothetical protein